MRQMWTALQHDGPNHLGLRSQVDTQLGELREFLEQKKVSKKVSHGLQLQSLWAIPTAAVSLHQSRHQVTDKVRSYMRILYRKKTGYNEKEVLRSLPPPLAKELMEELYMKSVKLVPVSCGRGPCSKCGPSANRVALIASVCCHIRSSTACRRRSSSGSASRSSR